MFVCLGFLTGAGFFCNDFGVHLNIEVDRMSKEISLSAASASVLLDRQEMPPAKNDLTLLFLFKVDFLSLILVL